MELISRDEAVSILQDMYDRADSLHESTDGDDWAWEEMKALQFAIDTIEERKVGMWIPYLPEYEDMFKCSECKEIVRLPFKAIRMPYKYCPNCGVMLKGEPNDSNT